MARPIPTLARRSPRLALGVLALVCILATPVAAKQGTAWPQFQGGPGHAGSGEAPAPPYRQLWRFSLPSGSASGAVIDGDVAITVGTETVSAVDLVTGEQAWRIPRAGGPISMPALATSEGADVLLYVEGSSSGAGAAASASPSPNGSASASSSPPESEGTASVSDLVAVDLADRHELWRLPLSAQSRSGVSVDGGTAFVGADDGTVTAVSVETGATAWTAEAIGRIQSPPAVADGKVYVVAHNVDGRQAQVLALDEQTGERAWEYLPPAGAAAASGVSVGDGLVVFGTSDRYVRGLDAATGEVRWAALGLSWYSWVAGPAIASGSAIIADSEGGLYRIDASDGSMLWDHQLNQGVTRSSPVVVGSTVLVGVNDGRLVGVDLSSGHLVWESPSSPGLVGPIALSSTAVVAARGGDRAGLIAFAHDPDGTLLDVPSPSVLDSGKTLGNYALALVLMSLVVFVPFRVLRSRIGPAFAGDDGQDDADPDEVGG